MVNVPSPWSASATRATQVTLVIHLSAGKAAIPPTVSVTNQMNAGVALVGKEPIATNVSLILVADLKMVFVVNLMK